MACRTDYARHTHYLESYGYDAVGVAGCSRNSSSFLTEDAVELGVAAVTEGETQGNLHTAAANAAMAVSHYYHKKSLRSRKSRSFAIWALRHRVVRWGQQVAVRKTAWIVEVVGRLHFDGSEASRQRSAWSRMGLLCFDRSVEAVEWTRYSNDAVLAQKAEEKMRPELVARYEDFHKPGLSEDR